MALILLSGDKHRNALFLCFRRQVARGLVTVSALDLSNKALCWAFSPILLLIWELRSIYPPSKYASTHCNVSETDQRVEVENKPEFLNLGVLLSRFSVLLIMNYAPVLLLLYTLHPGITLVLRSGIRVLLVSGPTLHLAHIRDSVLLLN